MTAGSADLAPPVDCPAGTQPLNAPALISFIVYGRPAPQGSKRGFVNKNTGKVVMVEQTAKTQRPWREDVRQGALAVVPESGPLDGPLLVRMVFTVAKPKSAPKRRRTWPATTPDLSKLLRSTEDAITSAGLWKDDARVVEYVRLAKVYPGEDWEALDRPGVRILIARKEAFLA